jgi:hypothetical protein
MAIGTERLGIHAQRRVLPDAILLGFHIFVRFRQYEVGEINRILLLLRSHDQVLRAYVPMNEALFVNVLYSRDYLFGE